MTSCEMNMTRSDLIIYLRKRLGMTQAQFADALDLQQSRISKFELNKSRPSIKTAQVMVRLAKSKKIKSKLEDFLIDD